jgi:hypothetical protein
MTENTMITDDEIETWRVAGDITLIFKHGTEADKQSLLLAIEQGCGRKERERIEQWIIEGMPGA